ncbi:MAG TPA: tetratricopeptide repeat protein [Blastocatellia bacterium]
MSTLRLKAAPVIAFAIVALTTATASAKDKWIGMTTKNLNIISNAGEEDTRELALKMEQFHFVISRLFNIRTEAFLPVTVIVFKDDSSFKPYKPLYNGKPGNLSGYFQPGTDENIIALNLRGSGERPLALIFHEYTHLITSYAPRGWPIWLNEGVAELYSTFDVKKQEVSLGVPVSHHVYLLRDSKFIPLQDLFNVKHDSPIYNEREKQGIFYAESWALTHYLMFGENMARQPQLVDFVRLLGSGVSVDRAFAQAFKTDPATMEKEVRRYMGKNSYPGMVYTLKSTEGEKDISVRPLSEAETLFHLGNMLMRTGRLDEAEQHFKRAITLDADLARPYEGLGFIEMRRDNFDKALEHFKEAVARDSKNHLAHYYYAEALEREARSGLTPELGKKIADELRTSIKLMPRFAYSYYSLGSLSLRTGENLREGVEMLAMALRLSPQDKHFALALSQAQIRLKDYAGARKTLEPLLAEDAEGTLKGAALSLMKVIDSFEHPHTPAEQAGEAPAEAGAASRARDTGEQGPPRSRQVVGQPTLKVPGTQVVRGVLIAIECVKGNWVLVVKVPERLARFTVSDKEKLEFYSQDTQFEGNIGCGGVNRPAFIYFKPAPPTQSASAGDAVAVEITK